MPALETSLWVSLVPSSRYVGGDLARLGWGWRVLVLPKRASLNLDTERKCWRRWAGSTPAHLDGQARRHPNRTGSPKRVLPLHWAKGVEPVWGSLLSSSERQFSWVPLC
ncbi:hypothetical protein [Vibrio penaeicida]|uniref:hypothetical protein n=1 Tax=Vibrio penaeicida TaxID=104609 RepID=UPI002D78BCDE|nr:hypothetical protein [Vibrio penaeicida]